MSHSVVDRTIPQHELYCSYVSNSSTSSSLLVIDITQEFKCRASAKVVMHQAS